MKIVCKSKGNISNNSSTLQAGQQVNRVGKYLYKHLDGAFKMQNSANMCDVYMTVLYQIPLVLLKKYNISEKAYQEVQEMTLNLNITTYQNKVRINIIEVTPEEKTIGFDVYTPEELENLQQSAEKIYQRVVKRIEKEFQDYEFLF
jgi:hypothetical protein